MPCCPTASSEQYSSTRENYFICKPTKDQTFALAVGTVALARSVVSLDVSGNIIFDNSNIIGILAYDVDETAGQVNATIFRDGKFNEDLILLAAGTPDTVREDLSKVGILLGKVEVV